MGGRAQRGQGYLYSFQPSFPSWAPPARALSLPADLYDSWGSSTRGIPLNSTGGKCHLHLLPPPLPVMSLATSVSKYTGSWLAVYIGIKKHQASNSFPQFQLLPLSRPVQFKLLLELRANELAAYSTYPLEVTLRYLQLD